nr:hypothetical protein [uncultured Rhodopila sp.]
MDGMFPLSETAPGVGAINAWMDEEECRVAEATTLSGRRAAAETYAALRELRAAVLAMIDGEAAHG